MKYYIHFSFLRSKCLQRAECCSCSLFLLCFSFTLFEGNYSVAELRFNTSEREAMLRAEFKSCRNQDSGLNEVIALIINRYMLWFRQAV